MINSRIKNSVVSASLKNTLPASRIRLFSPNTLVKSTIPNARGYNASSNGSSSTGGIVIGNPIGLLLSLTYATASGGSGSSNTSDFRPNIRLITN